jgi:hypothetical protein
LSIIHNLTQGKYQDLTYASVEERKKVLEGDKIDELIKEKEGDMGMGGEGDDGDNATSADEKKVEVASH